MKSNDLLTTLIGPMKTAKQINDPQTGQVDVAASSSASGVHQAKEVRLSRSEWGCIRAALQSEINVEVNSRNDSRNSWIGDFMASSLRREAKLRRTLAKVRQIGKLTKD